MKGRGRPTLFTIGTAYETNSDRISFLTTTDPRE